MFRINQPRDGRSASASRPTGTLDPNLGLNRAVKTQAQEESPSRSLPSRRPRYAPRRKATAIVSLVARSCMPGSLATMVVLWSLDDAQATWDDESAKYSLLWMPTVVRRSIRSRFRSQRWLRLVAKASRRLASSSPTASGSVVSA